MDLRPQGLQDKNKDQLKEILDALQIVYEKNDTNAILIQRIIESGKYDPKVEKAGGSIETNQNKKRVHKTLGEYKKVQVTPLRSEDQGTSIFVSINAYVAEFQPRTPVALPAKVISFLKDASVVEHYFDPNEISEMGVVGAHKTRLVPKYVVEILED